MQFSVDYALGFHDSALAFEEELEVVASGHWDQKFTYTFENFFHPFVGALIRRLNRRSLADLMDPKWQANKAEAFFDALYHPQNSNLVEVEFFDREFDVSEHGPYAIYNWELFFHIPLAIAVHLSKSQRFAEAMRWFHFIFDPTSTDKSEDPPTRFWRFLAFRKDDDPMRLDAMLALLSKAEGDLTTEEKKLRESILDGYTEILNKPFQPHVVARTRHVSYQYNVVMKYLDNLIAWGDFLFQQDTIESINEATQRYVLAANILGPKPQRIPKRGTVQARTFAQLKTLPSDPLGNALVDLEGQLPFNFAPATSGSGDVATAGPLFGIGRTLYFCIPRNEKLLGYWDTVADRLFKIRNCMSIAGVVRPLALFDPPIDPGLLVKAAAAGIDIGSIVAGLNQPIGPVRSLPLIRNALELCSEVRKLGQALLSALEKRDAEHLSQIRQGHQIGIHTMMQEVRFLQLKLAEESTNSLLTTRDAVLERYKFYQRQLSLPPDPNVPNQLKIDRRDMTEENFDEAFAALVGTYDKQLTLPTPGDLKKAGGSSPSQQSGATGAGQLQLTEAEGAELNSHLSTARDLRLAASITQTAAPVLSLIPDIEINLEYWGLGGSPTVFGGKKIAAAAKWAADVLRIAAEIERDRAEMSRRKGGYERRGTEWLREFRASAHELREIGRKILTSLIAEQIARHEFENVKKQIEDASEVGQILLQKFTNEELYTWMQGELSRLYYEYYRFAFDTARKAERTMKQELMRPELDSQSFVKFNYWDGGRKGLLSGEALHLDIKRMEASYLDHNKRELELKRDVSLRQLNPLELLNLKATASCTLSVPEWLFDRDTPGHYMRRIKSVAVSILLAGGPASNVYCTLTLLRSSVRRSPIPKDNLYARQGTGDDRFIDYLGGGQSIVTSGSAEDSGLFETDLKDDRFLPFEGAGAESTWKLDLARKYPTFDYASITDVVLHIRYTARQGVIASTVEDYLDELFQQATEDGPEFMIMFGLQQDFPAEWTAFVEGADFQVTIGRDRFPYFTQGKSIIVNRLDLYSADAARKHETGDPEAATEGLEDDGEFVYTAGPDAPGPTQVLTRTTKEEVFLVVRYSL